MNDDPGDDMSAANGRPPWRDAAGGATDAGEHDPWLREALRHAPDATATPPAALREAILAEARSAIRPLPRAARHRSLADAAVALWDWLARPAVAAGFASVMAVTIVGLMWWDRPMDEAMPQPTGQTEPLPAARPSVPLATPSPSTAPTAPAKPTDDKARSEVRRQAQRETANESRDAVRDSAARALAKKSGPAVNTPPPARDALGTDRLADTARAETTAPRQSERKAAPSADTDVAGRAAQNSLDPGQPIASRPPPTAATSPAPAITAAQENAAPAAFAAPAMALRRERATASSATGSIESESPTSSQDTLTRPVAALLAIIDRAPQRWRRADASDAANGLDDATRAWLASIETAAAGRWQEATHGRDALQTGSAADGSSLLLERDGHAAATLRVEANGVRLVAPFGTRFAPLQGDALEQLRRTLPPGR